jgi:hypothetical protein
MDAGIDKGLEASMGVPDMTMAPLDLEPDYMVSGGVADAMPAPLDLEQKSDGE